MGLGFQHNHGIAAFLVPTLELYQHYLDANRLYLDIAGPRLCAEGADQAAADPLAMPLPAHDFCVLPHLLPGILMVWDFCQRHR